MKSTKLLSSSPYAPADFGNQLIDDFGTITPPSEEQALAARRYVAGMAEDADDARALLAMLGLGAS
jgi:hypothetical protein